MRNLKGIGVPLCGNSALFAVLGIVFACVFVNTAYGVTTANGGYDPYEVLGLKRSAGAQDIRKAYKQLVVQWHPDKNKDPEAEDKFVLIKSAYEVGSREEIGWLLAGGEEFNNWKFVL